MGNFLETVTNILATTIKLVVAALTVGQTATPIPDAPAIAERPYGPQLEIMIPCAFEPGTEYFQTEDGTVFIFRSSSRIMM